MSYRIALVGGGSGGHVFPLVSVAQELIRQAQEKGVDLEMQVWGDGEIIKEAARDIGLPYRNIQSAKWRRYFSVKNFSDIFKIPVGLLQSLFYAWIFMPDIVFTKGGHSSLMPAFISKLFMIKVFIHESDSIPGKSNLLSSKIANKVFISFESSNKYFSESKTELVGNPVRNDIFGAEKKESLAFFGFSEEKPVIFIMGGSQGARVINEAVLSGILEFTNDFNIIHQVGEGNLKYVKSKIDGLIKNGGEKYRSLLEGSYKFFSFLDSDFLKYAYGAADVLIIRAGAGSIFEAAVLGKPVIIIPLLNSASGHQLENAREFSKYGAILLEEPNLTTHILISQIKKAHENRGVIKEKLKGFTKNDPAKIIASALLVNVDNFEN